MDHLKEEVGRRLKKAREEKDLTLQEVCNQVAGLTVSRLSNWENGIRMADVDVVKKLAPIYTTSAAYLLTLEDTQPDPREKALVELYKAADPRGQDTILRVAESESQYVDSGKRSDRAA